MRALTRSNSLLRAIRCCNTSPSRPSLDAETFFEYERDQAWDSHRLLEKGASLNRAILQLAAAGMLDTDSRILLPRFFASRYVPVVSTGSLKLDFALGIGGLPKGRIVEIFGKEASGKTTLALHIIKEAQKYNGYCAYIDVENGIEPSLLDSIGINTENLLFSNPSSAENTIAIIDILIKCGALDVIVVDSVAALLPQSVLDGSISAFSKDAQSKLIRRALQKINNLLGQSQTLVVFINQVRSYPCYRQEAMDADEVSCGGNALTFYSAMRLRTTRAGLLQTEDEVSGIRISVEVIKNKLAPMLKNAELNIRFGRGICCESEVLELASNYNIIRKDGNRYFIEDKYLRQTEAERYLAENQVLKDKLVTAIRTNLFGR